MALIVYGSVFRDYYIRVDCLWQRLKGFCIRVDCLWQCLKGFYVRVDF